MDASRPRRTFLRQLHPEWHAKHVQSEITKALSVPAGTLGTDSNYSSWAAFQNATAYGEKGIQDLKNKAKAATEALVVFGRILTNFAIALDSAPGREIAYLVHHKRLPGSNRTSRLRKKRRTRVDQWYRELKRRMS